MSVWRGSGPSIFVFHLISYSTPKRQNIFIKCQRLWYITAPVFRQEPTTQEQQTNKITNVKRPCYNFSGPVLFLALIHSKWINRQHAVRVQSSFLGSRPYHTNSVYPNIFNRQWMFKFLAIVPHNNCFW